MSSIVPLTVNGHSSRLYSAYTSKSTDLYGEASDIVDITLSQVMDFQKTSQLQTRANLLAPM